MPEFRSYVYIEARKPRRYAGFSYQKLAPLVNRGAYRHICKVTIIDKSIPAIIAVENFKGSAPPTTKHAGIPGEGDKPTKKIISYIKTLPQKNAFSNKGVYRSLIGATKVGSLDMVQELISNGADVNVKDKNGKTALIYATMQGNRNKAKLLIDNGADVSVKDNNNAIPLTWAAYYGHKDVVALLLNNGADINSKGSFNRTALIFSAQNGHKETVEFLINNGADVSVKDNNGKTALAYAIEKEYIDIAEILKKAGAKNSKRK